MIPDLIRWLRAKFWPLHPYPPRCKYRCNSNLSLLKSFYFALTLAVRTLEDLPEPGLVEQMKARLLAECGQASTVAAASQNSFNYVFRVQDVANDPAPQLVVSIADWQGNLRLSSDFGWMLDAERKPVRTANFEHRSEFSRQLREHLQAWLGIAL